MITTMLAVPQQAMCCILSSGWSPVVWILCDDVSEHSVCSIFICGASRKNFLTAYTTYEDATECSETSVHKIQTPRYHPEERIQRSNTAKVWNQEAMCLCVAGCRAEPGADWGRHRRAALDQEESQFIFLQKHGQLLLHLSPKLSVMSGEVVIMPYR